MPVVAVVALPVVDVLVPLELLELLLAVVLDPVVADPVVAVVLLTVFDAAVVCVVPDVVLGLVVLGLVVLGLVVFPLVLSVDSESELHATAQVNAHGTKRAETRKLFGRRAIGARKIPACASVRKCGAWSDPCG